VKKGEIQKLFEPKVFDLQLWAGDLFHDWDRDRFQYDGYIDFGGVKQHQFKGKVDGYLWHYIWLPTQEQLCEILYKVIRKDAFLSPPFRLIELLNRWGSLS